MAKTYDQPTVTGSKIGSRLDDLLRVEGIYEESQAQARLEVDTWQNAKMKCPSATKKPGTQK